MKQVNKSYGVVHIELSKNPLTSITVLNVEPFRKLAPRIFSTLANCKKMLQILKFLHQNSDFNDFEHVQLCKFPVENKNCYASHIDNVRKLLLLFQLTRNLMLNCKHKDLPNFLVITVKN